MWCLSRAVGQGQWPPSSRPGPAEPSERHTPTHKRPRSDNTSVPYSPVSIPLCSVQHLLHFPEGGKTPNHQDVPTTCHHDCSMSHFLLPFKRATQAGCFQASYTGFLPGSCRDRGGDADDAVFSKRHTFRGSLTPPIATEFPALSRRPVGQETRREPAWATDRGNHRQPVPAWGPRGPAVFITPSERARAGRATRG